jgi:hypothetical protein
LRDPRGPGGVADGNGFAARSWLYDFSPESLNRRGILRLFSMGHPLQRP